MLNPEPTICYEGAREYARPIRVFIVSDHRLFIDAVADIISACGDFSIAGFALADQCFEKIESSSADVVLIDATMEETDAVQLTRRLKEELPDLRIIVLGLEDSEEVILRFIEAGAVGYVIKEASLEDLFSTITAIYNRQSPCPPRLAASLFNRMVQLARTQRVNESVEQVGLTIREKEILRLMSSGLNNRDIAMRLNIALHTVKNHVHNILEKFHVHCRREAIRLARKGGLVEKNDLSQFNKGPSAGFHATSAPGQGYKQRD